MSYHNAYINHALNTSVFRNSCRFSKAQRFNHPKHSNTDFKYHIEGKLTSRTCNFGYGNRSGNAPITNGPSPNRYNVAEFYKDKRATTLGYSREEAVFRSLNNQAEKKAQLPSPDAYNTCDFKGKSFSLGMKLPGQSDSNIKKRVPGPGQYRVPQITPTGRYASSMHKNTRSVSFGHPQRPSTTQAQRLGPGAYDVFNMDSDFSSRKIESMRRNTSRGFGTGRRGPVEDASKIDMPGPGNYKSFSCFGGKQRFVPKIS